MTTSSAVHTAAAWEGLWLPRWPLASDHPAAEGVYRTSRARALAMRYLEHSPSALVTAVVIDCDHPDAALRAFEQPADHPKPNWVCLSPSGRGHLGWWLTSRVCNTEAARRSLPVEHRGWQSKAWEALPVAEAIEGPLSVDVTRQTIA